VSLPGESQNVKNSFSGKKAHRISDIEESFSVKFVKMELALRIAGKAGGTSFFDFEKDNISPCRYEGVPIRIEELLSDQRPSGRDVRAFLKSIDGRKGLVPDVCQRKHWWRNVESDIMVSEDEQQDIFGLTGFLNLYPAEFSVFRRIHLQHQNVFF